MIIGVDFGTCFSSIAVMDGKIAKDNVTGDLEQILGNTALGIPSLFMYSKEQKKEMYGKDCLIANPDGNPDVIKYMKKEVRKDPQNIKSKYNSGGVDYVLDDVIGKYIMYLIKSVKDQATSSGNISNTDVEVLTITKPVGIEEGQMMASDYSKLLKEKMMEVTGLSESKIHIIDEPVAAAISYLYEQDLNKKIGGVQNILVFDLGGGTLDTTIVRFDPATHTYEIIVKDGDLELGGKDWDDKLAELMIDKFEIPFESLEPKEKSNFWRIITESKIKLSIDDSSVQLFKYKDSGEVKKTYLECSRNEFEEACADLLSRSKAILTKTINQLSGGISSLDGIIMVGGSSNMPMIENMIIGEYPEYDRERIQRFRPSKAIARGAAIFSFFNSNDGGISGGAKIIDSTGCSYGFAALHHGEDEMIYNGIMKGEKFENGFIEYRSPSPFTPHRNDQKTVLIEMYESSWCGKNTIDTGVVPDIDNDEYRWMPINSGEKQNGMKLTIQVPPEYLDRACSFEMYPIFRLSRDGILDLTILDSNDKKIGFITNKN